ncbi:MAG: hypothetical protein WC516_00535 [Patescibacteria group bacterium]
MKITIPKQLNTIDVIKKSGYGLPPSRASGQLNFIRRLGGSNYPHFHAYVDDHVINLHLDQKQPSYDGSRAHSGEHDGEVVENEVRRIQEVINNLTITKSVEDKSEEKIGWWKKIF